MRKLYFPIILYCLLLASNGLLAQFSVTISTNPTNAQLTCNVKSITLTANVTSAAPVIYKWNILTADSSSANIPVTEPGTYIVNITDTVAHQTSSSSIYIIQDTAAPAVMAYSIPGEICAGGTATLVGQGAATYLWQPDPTTPVTPPSQSLVNVTPGATTKYTVTGTANNGCTATNTITVVVHPLPTASISVPENVCRNTSALITFMGSGGTSPYNFTYNINGVSTQVVSTAGVSDWVAVNASTGALGKLGYNLLSVADKNGCTQKLLKTDTVEVLPGPLFRSDKTKTICNGDSVKYTAISSIPDKTTFSWSRDSVTGIKNARRIGTTATVAETLINNTTRPIPVTYVFTLSAGTGCETTESVVVTVNPTPVLIIIKDQTYCNGATVEGGIKLNSTSSDAIISWNINRTDIGLKNEGEGDIPQFKAINNNTDRAITATVTVDIAIGDNKCKGKSFTFNITVLPAPVLIPPLSKSICNNQIVDYRAVSSAPGTTSFNWKRDLMDGITTKADSQTTSYIGEKLENITDQPIPVPYIFSLSTGGVCVTKETVIVTVNPTLKMTLPEPPILCNNTFFTYTASTTTKDPDFRWTRREVPGLKNGFYSLKDSTINETLINISLRPVTATYVFTLSSGAGCATVDSIMVTVNPSPKITKPDDDTLFCNGYFVDRGIPFISNPAGASFTWTNTGDSIGLQAAGGTESIPPFIAKNMTTSARMAIIKVHVNTADINCPADSARFSIMVQPTPVLNTPKIDTICDNAFFYYKGNTDFKGAGLSWTRPAVVGIGTRANGAVTDTIHEMLDDTTSQPVNVRYIFTLLPGGNNVCRTQDTVTVTVNPTAPIDSVSNKAYCNGDFVRSGIALTSISRNASIKWTNTDRTIGLPSGSSGSIPPFIATNTTDTVKTAIIRVRAFIKRGIDTCFGDDASFTITVKPSPPRPSFTSLSRYSDNDTLKLCNGSENINFNVNSIIDKIAYNWSTNSPALIKDVSHGNTVISFLKPGTDTIRITATDTVRHCASTVSQIVKVSVDVSGIEKQQIFQMQPGNLLIYPNNSLAGYQWGYDRVISDTSITPPVKSYGAPVPVEGQVYQFFIPDTMFLKADKSLDTTRYLFWVLLQNNNCYTKFYYKGPYANRVMEAVHTDSTVRLQIFPNPNKGSFEIALKGNIYGNIKAQIYNALGQIVFTKNFVKTFPEINEKLHTSNLPGGIYFLIMYSSDMKKVSSRFVIQR